MYQMLISNKCTIIPYDINFCVHATGLARTSRVHFPVPNHYIYISVRAFSGCFIWLFKKICLLLIREYVVGLPHKTTILFYCTIFYFHFWVFHARVGKSLLMRSAQAIVSYQNKWLRCSRKNTNTFIKLFYEVMRQSTSPNMASMALSAIEDKFDAITSYPLGSYKWPQSIFLAISV